MTRVQHLFNQQTIKQQIGQQKKTPYALHPYPLHQIISILGVSLKHLSASRVADSQLEQLACLIHEVMSEPKRRYHVSQHLLSMTEVLQGESLGDGLAILATLFHDLIFLRIDQQIPVALLKTLSDFELSEHCLSLVLPELVHLKKDPLNLALYTLYSVQPGLSLTLASGLNEFLSSFVALRLLRPFLSDWQLMQVIACIEATIPFRINKSSSLSVAQLQEERLQHVLREPPFVNYFTTSEDLQLAIRTAVQRSIGVANADIANFFSPDAGYFLSQTWMLILEGNPIFQSPIYGIQSYRIALQKMRNFFQLLRPEQVVREYQGEPVQASWSQMQKAVQTNLELGRAYIDAKLLGVAVLESIATLTGGDAPLALFLGEVPRDAEEKSSLFETFLNTQRLKLEPLEKNQALLHLLKYGRASGNSYFFDFEHSPIADYLYQALPKDLYQALLIQADLIFSEQLSPQSFLREFPQSLLEPLLEALLEVASTRKSSFPKLWF